MRTSYRVLIVFIIAIILLMPICKAESLGLGDLANYQGDGTGSDKLNAKMGNLLGVIQIIGTVISVITLIAIGIKYLLGSIEEKAEYKKTLMPYVIGAFLVFAGTAVPQIIYKFMQNF